ncbi:hypothetical protein [Salinicola endophyticus]|uniref:hypothetical protein n=1 Tax=Salinicola endophyticus TaxID=1949083 RepID=UPI000DA1A87F|nr:hypothetical protein [Salinicola endophyticus]
MKKRITEPVKKPAVWIGFGVLFTLVTPWYFPAGSWSPLFWGIPYWALIIIAVSLALSIFITWVVLCQWDTGADETEDER